MTKLITVDFHEDTLFAIKAPEGVMVALKPIADRLGLDWSAQLRRTKRDPILAKGVAVMAIPSPGGEQEAACLPLNLLPGWLFGIDVSRLRPDIQPSVLRYQEECHAVLFRHFFGRHDHDAELRSSLPGDPAREEPVSVRRGLVSEARQTFGVRAAGSLWFALGLPIVPEMREGRRQPFLDFTYDAVRQDAPAQPQGGK